LKNPEEQPSSSVGGSRMETGLGCSNSSMLLRDFARTAWLEIDMDS
jgi:hypothetical protein